MNILKYRICLCIIIVVTVFLFFTQISFKIQFENSGDSPISPVYKTIYSNSDLPTPTKKGYRFIGWYLDEEYTIPYRSRIDWFKTTYLYAKWEKQEYEISYFIHEDLYEIRKETDLNSVLLFEPILPYYRFLGWYKDLNLNQPCTREDLNEDTLQYSLYARMEHVTYTYELHYGENILIDESKEEKFVFPELLLPKGYQIEEWYYDSSFTKYYDENKMIEEQLILYAKLEKIVYSICYMDENGDYLKKDSYYGGDSILPFIPEKEEASFLGWYKEQDGIRVFQESQMPYENIILYAKFQINQYSITYIPFFEEEKKQLVEYGTRIDLYIPKKEGFVFQGWYLEKTFQNRVEEPYRMKRDTTFYALYKIQEQIPIKKEGIYQIQNIYHLAWMYQHPDQDYQLKQDIDCWNIPIFCQNKNFTGTFEGNGYMIFNLFVYGNTESNGCFLSNEGTIQNVTIEYEMQIKENPMNSIGFIEKNKGVMKNIKIKEFLYIERVQGNISGFIVENQGSLSEIQFHQQMSLEKVTGSIGGVLSINTSSIEKLEIINSSFSLNNQEEDCSLISLGVAMNKEEAIMRQIYLESNTRVHTSGKKNILFGALVGVNEGTVEQCYTKIKSDFECIKASIGGICGRNQGTLIKNIYHTDSYFIRGETIQYGGAVFENSGDIRVCIIESQISIHSLYSTIYGGIVAQNHNGYYLDAYSLLENSYTFSGMGFVETTIGLKESKAKVLKKDFLISILRFDTDIWVIENGFLPILKNNIS